MAIGRFLFGGKRSNAGSLNDKIYSDAVHKTHSKIRHSRWNSPSLVFLRRFFVYPILKLPMLPAREALEVRPLLKGFVMAMGVLRGNGLASRAYVVPKGGLKPGNILTVAKAVLWRPLGDPLQAEYILSLKLLFAALSLWAISMILFSMALWQGGGALVFALLRGVVSLLTSLQTSGWLGGPGKGHGLLLWSALLWTGSLVLAVYSTNRPWVKATDRLRVFLKQGLYRPEEIDTKAVVLATGSHIYISTPSLKIQSIKQIQSGWPDGFLPGEVFESINNGSEILIKRRPLREPIIFSGEHAAKDIKGHMAPYQKKIIGHMKGARKNPHDPELLFLGEVTDPDWWMSSQIYVSIANSPHMAIVGRTRSGKTKGAQSFVYAQAAAYPDSEWFFADGKGSADWDIFAEYLSEWPVAKPNPDGDALVQLANIIEAVWQEFMRRRNLFEKARAAGKPCSTIFDYRAAVGHLPHVFLVIEEFHGFVTDMDYDPNKAVENTMPYRLSKITTQAASFGIHLIVCTQRYQVEHIPSSLRSNLGTRLVYSVNQADANFLEIPSAPTLKPGQCFVDAPGLFCEHSGQDKIKTRLPYIGDQSRIVSLFKETIKPIEPERKKKFDLKMDYVKGSADMDSISVSALCVKLFRFFAAQDYVVDELTQDVEASNLQLEIRKARGTLVKNEDGVVERQLIPTGAPPIGVAVLKADEIEEDVLATIQEEHKQYPAIIVFIAGKAGNAQRYSKTIKDLNERGTRFFVYSPHMYRKDMRNVDLKTKQGLVVDLIAKNLQRLGLAAASHNQAASAIEWDQLSAKSPAKLKVAKICEALRLPIVANDSIQGIPAAKAVLPGGVNLVFLIGSEKIKKEDLRSVASDLNAHGHAVAIVSDEKYAVSERSAMKSMNQIIIRNSLLDDWVTQGREGRLERKLIGQLMNDLGLFSAGNDGRRQFVFGREAKLTVSATLNASRDMVTEVKVGCTLTRNKVVMAWTNVSLKDYRLDFLGIPEAAEIVVENGLAPRDARPDKVRVRIAPGGATTSFPPSSPWDVVGGILTMRQAKIAANDPILEEMRLADQVLDSRPEPQRTSRVVPEPEE